MEATIKFIASDMDGTLLNSKHQLPDDFHEVFDALYKKDILFAAASGRQYFSLLKTFEKIEQAQVVIYLFDASNFKSSSSTFKVEIEKIKNTYTLFEKIVYNDKEMDYNNYNKNLSKKFVKVVVAEKTDTFTFDRFIDNIQNQDIYELKIAENFNEFMGENVEDDNISFEDTTEVVDTYIEAVDTDLDKNKIKVQMRELMTEAQALEIA